MKALILAGGVGTRLWPLSRMGKPKQVHPFFDKETLLQKTYNRLGNFFKPQDIWLATGNKQLQKIKLQVPKISNFSLEPIGRNTAPAIGLATLKIAHEDPESTIVTVNSDQYIGKVDQYLKVLKTAEKLVQENPNHIVLVGIETAYPETGYGYIEQGNQLGECMDNKYYQVKSFKEKPDIKTAQKYHSDKSHLWNPAIFVYQAKTLLEIYKKYLPEMYELLMKINKNIQDQELVEKYFVQMESISIDYGIMEKTDKLIVLPAEFGWLDIGSWRAVYDVMSKKEKHKNITNTELVEIDSNNNLIYGENDKVVATIGLEDMIIIDTKDALLVAPKNRAQEVKKIVDQLKDKKLNKYL